MHTPNLKSILAVVIPLLATPAWADELETDELPSWMVEEIEDATYWEGGAQGAGPSYGADIPSPEDVVRGGPPPAPAAMQHQPAPMAAAAPQPEGAVGFQDFYAGLSPHGSWVETRDHGLVFVPGTHIQVSGWRPYLHGQWAWTQYGWTWVSDEPFGWATYHYGRWSHSPSWGWYWVPGYTWGPAWVAWRYGSDSIGWAPLYPGHVTVGVSYPVHTHHWIFIGHSHFHGHPIHRHWYRGRTDHYFHRSSWARHWRYSGRVYVGPRRTWVERRHGRGRIVETRIVHAKRPSASRVIADRSGRRVSVYRPGAQGAIRPTGKRAPARYVANRGRPGAGSGLVKSSPARRAIEARPSQRKVSPSNRNTAPRQRQVAPAPSQRKVSPSNRNTSPRQRQVAPAPSQRQVSPSNRNASPRQRQVAPSNRNTAPRQRQVAPAPSQRKVSPSNRNTSPRQRQVAPAPSQRQVSPNNRNASPRRQQVSPSNRNTAPRQRQVSPSNRITAPRQRQLAPNATRGTASVRSQAPTRSSQVNRAPSSSRSQVKKAPSTNRRAPARATGRSQGGRGQSNRTR